MKKQFAILSVILLTAIYGCNSTASDENTELLNTALAASTAESEHQHTENDSIELNNGAKWKVVPEMMTHIRNMESDIARFAETKNTELGSYTKLGTSLQKNIDLLTSNCTMEGKAHDELHKWLLPYIDMVDHLNHAENSEDALHTFEQINSSYKTFNRYFE